jgi:hypothetical protein
MNATLLRGRKLTTALVALAGVLCSSSPLLAANSGKGNGNGGGTAAGSVVYSGQAIALKVDGILQPQPGQIVVCDTGALPGTGGHLQVTQSDVNFYNGLLTIDHASAITMGSGPEAASESTLTGFRGDFIDEHGERVLIEADLVHAEVSASSDKKGKVTTSSNVIVQGLKVNGQVVNVTGQPNQVVQFGDTECRLVINEQANAGAGTTGDVAVSAIHFYVCGCIEGHIGLVRSGITVNGTPPPPAEEECGKVTGGGWIVGTPSGAKGTFGMSGGIRRGEFWGHLQYNDHGTGMKVKSTAVTGFQIDPTDAKGRIINYNCTINGAPGTATLRVVDNGEPGRNDIFDLTLSTGYHAAGDLGGGRPGGGNIQLHKCPPGWE